MTTRKLVVLAVACLATAVLVPAGALAQANEDADADEVNDVDGALDEDEADETEEVDEAPDEDDDLPAPRPFPAREGPIEDPEDVEEVGVEPASAALFTLSVIIISLLVGFAFAALGGRRR